MYITTVISIFSGIIIGIITGITPGIHINLIAASIVAYSYYILKILDPLTIVIALTAMAITHTVFDIIPTTILGIPNTENLNALIPTHKLTSEGKASLAIKYGLLGSALGIITTIILAPMIIKIIVGAYTKIKDLIPIMLIVISAYLILKSKNKFLSIIFFLTSGIVGILSFNIKTIEQPLLPLLSGLFGLSSVILSIKNDTKIPAQEETNLEISNKDLIKHGVITTIASLSTNILPGLTSSHTALLASKITKIKDNAEYIILSNSSSSSATIISFIAFYTIAKTRSGAVSAISFIMEKINISLLILIFSTSLISLAIAILLAKKISRSIIQNINKVNYKKLSISIIFLVTTLVLIITKLEGLLILIVSTSIGILAQQFNIERINLTGCLIFPVILYIMI